MVAESLQLMQKAIMEEFDKKFSGLEKRLPTSDSMQKLVSTTVKQMTPPDKVSQPLPLASRFSRGRWPDLAALRDKRELDRFRTNIDRYDSNPSFENARARYQPNTSLALLLPIETLSISFGVWV